MRQSRVEKFFLKSAVYPFLDKHFEKISVLTVNNYIALGQLTALRFIEWALANPEGVVSLQAGKTPQHFIKWLHYYLDNWEKEHTGGILPKVGITAKHPPLFNKLYFVQMDEFFPIPPDHERSFNNYVKKYYIGELGFDIQKALLFNTSDITLSYDGGKQQPIHVEDLFPDSAIDLNLREKLPADEPGKLRKRIIRHFDQVCEDFEADIRALGGIGFFLSSIGPGGTVAHNTFGASHHSATRLTTMNYETMAAAAGDLGGIEVVRKKAVVTIGLETITFNPDCTAIIFAAGEENAGYIAQAVENDPQIHYPASALQKLANARFYLTDGAASKLTERRFQILLGAKSVPETEIDKLVIDGALLSETKLTLLKETGKPSHGKEIPHWKIARHLTKKSLQECAETTRNNLITKIHRGLDIPKPQRFLHTGPHHDDIELAYFPLIHHLVRSPKNLNYFCYMTSGFTSVTNDFVREKLTTLIAVIKNGKLFKAVSKNDLFNPEYKEIEIHGYLNAIAQQNTYSAGMYTAMRLCRHLAEQLQTGSDYTILAFAQEQLTLLQQHIPGTTLPDTIKLIKSWIRQWEAELVWAHFGLDIRDIYHLQLKFYSDNMFPKDLNFEQDVKPIVDLLMKIKPTTITLALDPEGSGPDTHYKTLLAIRRALQAYIERYDKEIPRIWGYRNVWSNFHPAKATMIVPVSLNSFAVLHNMFNTCYLSQKSASFPSSKLDGTFSELAQKTWVRQFNDLTRLLGKGMFYNDDHPMMRRAYGAIYFKDMSYEEFVEETKEME